MAEMMVGLHRTVQLWLCTHVVTFASRSAGVRELRAGLAEAVRCAEAGERTVVTVGGRPVAQLGPLDADAPDLERLIGSGAVIPPRRTSDWRPPEPVPVWAGVRIDQVLRELRG
jgi:antitoxin (DNA-binding transcriptional repressor) of toxin-antitoxin stability system